MFQKKVTTKLIEEYLDRYGWKNHAAMEEPGEERGFVLTGWQSLLLGEGLQMVIDPVIEKQTLVFQVTGIAKADPDTTPSDRLVSLLLKLLEENKVILTGAFAFGREDGEVILRWSIPIASDDLAYEDFERCIKTLTATAELNAVALRKLIAEG
jgi:hypothetical protein